jgi:hypothetical protein
LHCKVDNALTRSRERPPGSWLESP